MADELLDNLEQAWLDDWFDEPYHGTRERRCVYCGARYLHWERTPDGWRLFTEQGDIHNCLVEAATPEEFGIVIE